MKRSQINRALREMEAMCAKYHCYLPPFCHFTPEEWADKGHEYDEIRDCMLGWDTPDFGQENFDEDRVFADYHSQWQPQDGGQIPKVYAEKRSTSRKVSVR